MAEVDLEDLDDLPEPAEAWVAIPGAGAGAGGAGPSAEVAEVDLEDLDDLPEPAESWLAVPGAPPSTEAEDLEDLDDLPEPEAAEAAEDLEDLEDFPEPADPSAPPPSAGGVQPQAGWTAGAGVQPAPQLPPWMGGVHPHAFSSRCCPEAASALGDWALVNKRRGRGTGEGGGEVR